MPPDVLRDLAQQLFPSDLNTLPDVLAWRARRQPHQRAFTFLVDGEEQEEQFTYAQLDGRARAIAEVLTAKGAAGQRALLVYDAGLEYIAALYGCLYAGVVAVPVYPPDPFRIDRTLPRLQAILADAGATWLLATRATLDWAGPLFAKAQGMKSSLATDECHEFETPSSKRGIDADSLAILQYTSGSTGEPRGVVISHRNLMANLTLIHRMVDRDDAVAVSWLPAYHDMGLIGVTFQPVFSGRPAVLLSPVAFMQRPYRWLNAISRFRGTTTAAPNFAYDLCVRKVTPAERATLDLSSLALALNGAEAVRAETLDRFSEAFAPCGFRRKAFYPCYGLAEATLMVSGGAEGELPVVKWFDAGALKQNRAVVRLMPEVAPGLVPDTVAPGLVPGLSGTMPVTPATTAGITETRSATPATRAGATRLVGCGRAAYSQRVLIVDPQTLQPLPECQVGEIWVSGPSIGGGYWNRPRESAETFAARLGNGDGPFLRTGDLGFLDGGELFVTGRLKDLIILQGRNHYPHDIERTVADSHAALKLDGGAAFSVDVSGQERLVIVQEVMRPRKVDLPAVAETIRARIAELHGVTVSAVCLIPAGTLPKTSSGKTRRRACREFFLAGSLGTVYQWREDELRTGGEELAAEDVCKLAATPSTPTECRLAQIWSDVLGIEPRNIHASFFDIGGQSLLASQLAARVQAEFDVEMPIRVLFESPTIARLAGWLDGAAGRMPAADLPPVIRADRESPLPLSSFQEQLWFLEQLEPAPRYLLSATMRVRGALDRAALERSLRAIVARHEALRTVFRVRDGQPLQEVLDVGWADHGEFHHLLDNPLGRSLSQGPLLRATLSSLGANEHLLTLTIHHLICDGWSLSIFLQELAALYQAEVTRQPANLPPVPLHYADFAVWQRACVGTQHVQRQLDYCKQQLAELTPLELATDFSPVPSRGQSLGDAPDDTSHDIADSAARRENKPAYLGAEVRFTISQEAAESLATLGRQHDATLYMVLLAAFQSLLARWTRQDDVCVGSPISYRPRREFERSIGYFVNTLALRSDLSGDPSFGEVLARVRETVLAAFSNADAPLTAIVDALAPQRAEGRSPLFNCMFVFENLPWHGSEAAGLSIGEVQIDHSRIGGFDLALVVEPRAAGLNASVVYHAELFEPATIKHFCNAFQLLLAGVVAQPDAPVTSLPLAEEDSQLSCSPAPPAQEPFERIHDLISDQAERAPDATAVVHDDRQITYQELERRANQLAHYLQALGLTPDMPVAIFLDRSIEMVVAMLAVLKSGGAYVPLDAAETSERLTTMLDNVEARAIITTRRAADRLPPHRAEEIWLDSHAESIAQAPQYPPAAHTEPGHLAYIVYTSGSTGRPKGVEVTHAGLANHARAMAALYELGGGDRVLQIISPAFDVAAEEVFPTLIRGANLVLGPATNDLSGRAILERCRRHRVSVAHIPPPLLQQCLLEWEAADASLFDHWRVLVVGGEPLRAEMLNQWLELAAGRVRLLHEYGLTETTITSLVYEVPRGLTAWPKNRRLPIGAPIAGTEAWVLDHRQRPLPVGAPGELYLGGVGLARGYYRLDDQTAERFVPHPFSQTPGARLYRTGDLVRRLADGDLEFLGRLDEQIKLRGWRIEPKEIEQAIRSHPAVGEAAVVAREDMPGAKRLVAYVVSANGEMPSPQELRQWLRGKLPEPMVPSAVMRLARLPLNRHHKLDVAALPPPLACPTEASGDAAPFAAPRTECEQTLASIWQELLNLPRVGIHDNFFELGGDSILSIQVVARARQAGLYFNPRQLFQHQTIAELAAVEGTGPAVTAEQGEVSGTAPLTPIQHWFLDDEPIDPHHFNQAVMLKVGERLSPQALPEALSRLAAHHDALRLRFSTVGHDWRQWHGSIDGSWPLERFDFSHLPPGEQTAGLQRAASRMQSSLHLEKGPLARAGWFDLGQRGRRLLLVVHHLAIDAVSWRVLLDDLASVWMSLGKGESPTLPPKTTSFQHWARRLIEYCQSQAVAAEVPYWRSLADAPIGDFPRDLPDAENLQASLGTVSLDLDEARTTALLEQANAPYRTHTPEILLAALAQTLAHFVGRGTVLIDVEGHGRAALFDDVDLSRSVGWFTAAYPVLLDAPHYLPPGTLLRRTKELLRRVPADGVGYGVLRYLSPDAEVRNLLAALPRAEVAFNYLGQLDGTLADSSPLAIAGEPIGPLRSPRAARRHLLEINLFIRGGRLSIDVGFSQAIHRQDTIERFAADYRERLISIIDHCLSPQAGGFTPSDFPLAKTNERELEKIADLLGDS